MVLTRYSIAGIVCLIGGGVAIVAQYFVTPLSGADLAGAELLAKVTAEHAAMGWTLVLDIPLLLAVPAMLFVGALAGMKTSRLAAAATVLLFFPLLMSLPAVVGFDGLAYFAAIQPDRAAMVQLIDAWQGSLWYAISLYPYVVCQLIGSVLMAVALIRARAVPVWAAVAVGVWPLLASAGIALNARPVAALGYGVLLVGWTACAVRIGRRGAQVSANSRLVTA